MQNSAISITAINILSPNPLCVAQYYTTAIFAHILRTLPEKVTSSTGINVTV